MLGRSFIQFHVSIFEKYRLGLGLRILRLLPLYDEGWVLNLLLLERAQEIGTCNVCAKENLVDGLLLRSLAKDLRTEQKKQREGLSYHDSSSISNWEDYTTS